jgi:hypothetical protein
VQLCLTGFGTALKTCLKLARGQLGRGISHGGPAHVIHVMDGENASRLLALLDARDRRSGAVIVIYIYSVNNPSEGTIAKRRSYAELISYLTPPIENAGL